MLIGRARRLRVGKGLNKCENEGSSVHDPSDEVSEAKASEANTSGSTGCKNGLVAPDAPTTGASDFNEANGFAVEAMFTKNTII